MSHKAAKVGVTTLVLATAFGIMLYTTMGESMQYYKYVDEVTADPAAWQGKNLQVHGYVVPGSIGRKRDALEYKFDIQRNGVMAMVIARKRSVQMPVVFVIVSTGFAPRSPQNAL